MYFISGKYAKIIIMTKQMMILIAIIIYILTVGFLIEPKSLTVTSYKIECPSMQGIKIAFLSDLHLGKTDFERLDKIVSLTNAQKPDIVLLGGGYGKKNKQASMKPEILAQKLSKISGQKFAVLSDDDWNGAGSKYVTSFNSSGISTLENMSTTKSAKGKFFDIIGIADYTSGKSNIANAFAMTNPPRLVFTHNPDIYYDIMDDAVLILAGHTHGGQFVFPLTPPLFVPSKYGTDFASGLINPKHNKMIVSKGIGVDTIPVRFNCKPEIITVEFVPYGIGDGISK